MRTLQKGSRRMNVVSLGFCVLAILCMIYAIMIICYVGVNASQLWLWPFMSVILLAIALLSYIARVEHNKICSIIVGMFCVLFCIGIMILCIIEGIILGNSGTEPQNAPDYVIVLGAKVKGKTVSKALKERLDRTVEYCEKHQEIRIIVSGGQGTGEDISEAQAMYEYLTNHGIDCKRIRLEDQSVNTEQNIKYSWELIKDKNATVAIVSNRFHVFRAVAIAKKTGIQRVEGVSAKTDPIMRVHYYLREAIAVLKYKLAGTI